MNTYIVLKLQGVMQAWGGHTYEDLRHTELIPTRSGLVGLLAACLGIDRSDVEQQTRLAESVLIAVRSERPPQRIIDFHTVLDARKVDGKPNPHPVVSRREYLCDAQFTVLLKIQEGAYFSAEQIETALKKPVFTPFLGRRSCPLGRPLFDGRIEAVDFESAFELVEPTIGTIYSEARPKQTHTPYRLRDIPLYGRKRQFATRELYIYQQTGKEAV